MNIHEYIQSFTNVDKDSKVRKIKLTPKLLPSDNLNAGIIHSFNFPYQLNLKNCIKTKIDDLGLYVLNTVKKCYEKIQQKYVGVAVENNSNKSDVSYVTASSASENSYLTTIEDFKQFEECDCDIEKEISFDSGIDDGKRELIIRLLQSKASGSLYEENIIPDDPNIPCKTQDLFDNTELKQKCWDENINDQLMYEDRISRLFQTTVDFECLIEEKRLPASKYTRQYFMNLTDKHFSEFEKRESL